MGWITKLRRLVSVATGDLGTILKDVEIPPLPTATARLVQEISAPDPDLSRLVTVISTAPDVTAKVLQTVNSSLFGLRTPVISVRHAVSLLGMRHIRPIVLSHAMRGSLPVAADGLFDPDAFWTDCLLRSVVARSLAHRLCPGEQDEAFTAMLVSDVAVPVLLNACGDYYAPVVIQWRAGAARLSEIEREALNWDHAQAAAWILQQWGLPQELVCFAGFHNASPADLDRHGLQGSIALPLVLASRIPSVLQESPARARDFVATAGQALGEPAQSLRDLLDEAATWFEEVRQIFDLDDGSAAGVLEQLRAAVQAREGKDAA